MAIKPKALYTVQLAVIAALVDGEASQPERDAITQKVSEHFRVDADEVSRVATLLIEQYQERNINSSPSVALHFALKSLSNLPLFDRPTAFRIAEEVIESGGKDQTEIGFLARLKTFSCV